MLYGDTYVQIPGGDDPQKVQMMGTNNSFWRLFSFSFVEGKLFSEEEFQSGFPRVVVSESLGTPYLFDNDRRDGEKHPAG